VSVVPVDDALPPHPLDDVDRAIVEMLQLDGRVAFDSVAAAVGTDEDDVRTRVETLLAHGVVDIVAVTDPLQLGYPRQAMLGILVDGPSQQVGLEIAQIEEVIYQARTTGGFDLLVELVGTSDAHLLELVARIRRVPRVSRIHTFLYQELVKENYAYGTAEVTAP
jgi:Lrp/AsnC family transcriptional regulator, regulator for asnA, asnC and gidA